LSRVRHFVLMTPFALASVLEIHLLITNVTVMANSCSLVKDPLLCAQISARKLHIEDGSDPGLGHFVFAVKLYKYTLTSM